MNDWAFFQYSILFSGLKKSGRENNVDFSLPCYLIEVYETVNFKCFDLNISIQITIYVKPPNPTSLKNDCVLFPFPHNLCFPSLSLVDITLNIFN